MDKDTRTRLVVASFGLFRSSQDFGCHSDSALSFVDHSKLESSQALVAKVGDQNSVVVVVVVVGD